MTNMIIDSGAAFTFEFPIPSTESVTGTTAVEASTTEALHKAIVPALIDLHDLSARNDWAGREEYTWITYDPPYKNSPYHSPASLIKTCYNCRRDGHVIRKCGFETERRKAHHRNRYQRSKAAHDYARTTQESISRRSTGIKIPLKFR
ncbi:hypothetical protein CC2G_005922 [Coprinopsis cinerea AmutBmut pab1-1]|nr:hypothetical protein CC2G_005922 [Coprinopsis cinerea AmutBmut pab1-1]